MVEDKRLATRVSEDRERVIARLSDVFAQGDLEIEEFDRRVDLAHRAETVAALEALTADLPAAPVAGPLSAPAPRPPRDLVPAGDVRPSQSVVAIMGGARRTGRWTVARKVNVVSVMGGTVLDFREAQLPAGPVDVRIFALMGGVQIVVPPTLAVEKNGLAIMGGFDDRSRAPASPDPEAPLLRIHGIAVMGGVDIQTRLPGESERDARRRDRAERKELRRLDRRRPATESRAGEDD